MNNILVYSLSFGGFLVMALWWLFFKNKMKSVLLCLIYSAIFIMLGVLSIKYIDVLPIELINWFKYPTIIMALVGGFGMLAGTTLFLPKEDK